MKRKLAAAAAVVGCVLGPAGLAFAAWTIAGTANGATMSTQVGQGNKPTASISGRDVTLTWTAASVGSTTAQKYSIARSNVSPQSLSTTLNGTCASAVAALTCTDTAVPENATSATNWTYTDTPQYQSWTGPASSSSDTVSVPAPSLSLGSNSVVQGATLSATVANFFDGESVTYHLDSSTGTVLGTDSAGAASAAPNNGAVTTTLTIPAATSAGSHSVVAVGGSGSAPSSQSLTVTAAASISLGSPIALKSTSVSITGSNFSAGKSVAIKFNGATPTTNCSGNTTSGGALPTPCTFTVPSGTADSLTPYTVQVTVNGVSATASLTVYSVTGMTFDAATIPSPPWPGQSGVSLDTAGSSKFNAKCGSGSLTAAFDGTSMTLTTNGGTSPSGGVDNTDDAFAIPSDLAAGSTHVIAIADCGTPAPTKVGAIVYTVPAAGIAINPTTGSHSSGVSVTVYGTGFTPGATVTIKVGATTKGTATATATNGALPPTAITAGPFGASGSQTITASDGTHSYTATYTAT